MPKTSAGLLMFRRSPQLEVFLVHPGGPFWARKDLASWSIPKGEYSEGEDPLAAALREFAEETSLPAVPPFLPLGQIRQAGGKLVTAWAFEGDADPAAIRSNLVSIEWPTGSGKMREFPEVDRAAWFTMPNAAEKILKSQALFLERLAALLEKSI